MILDSNGKAVRNPFAKHIFDVQLNDGNRKFRKRIPADTVREAMAVAENENPKAVAVERATVMLTQAKSLEKTRYNEGIRRKNK